ncbi:MAG TPA: GatB/YqeY domain-containing protein [Gammaproteobacteria bacterium]|nr:GatB/YqeY domain-containing protein [Gammaproteobacteria bacterium]
MSLKDQITSDMKEAMKAGAKERLAVIRLILAAVKQKEVDERITLDDAQLLAVLDKMLKQRRESVAQFLQGNRKDLADKEEAEIKVIQSYMPAQLSDAELDKLVAEAVAQSGAASVKDMGKVMGILKPQVTGKADMSAVSARIKAKLGV